jgi:hypothetical protein
MRSTPLVVLLLFLVLAALTAAQAGAAVPSRGEFIRKGDALCARVKREMTPVVARAEEARKLPESRQWAAVADIWADQIAIQRRFVARFRALGAPRNDRAARQIVAGLDRGVVLAERVGKAFATRNTAAIPSALRAYLEFTLSTNRRVVAYGFRVCGR